MTRGRHPLALLIWEMGATVSMMKVRLQRLIQGRDFVLFEAPRGPWWPCARLSSPSSLGFPFEGPASSDLDSPGGQWPWRARRLGKRLWPRGPFCPSRHLLAMRMKLRVPHSQQGGALAFVCSQVLAGGGGSFHLFTPLGPAWWNPRSPDAGQSSRRLTTPSPPKALHSCGPQFRPVSHHSPHYMVLAPPDQG